VPKTGSLLARTGTSSRLIPIGRVGEAGGAKEEEELNVAMNDSFIDKNGVEEEEVPLLCII
jgi:hypothetical protein